MQKKHPIVNYQINLKMHLMKALGPVVTLTRCLHHTPGGGGGGGIIVFTKSTFRPLRRWCVEYLRNSYRGEGGGGLIKVCNVLDEICKGSLTVLFKFLNHKYSPKWSPSTSFFTAPLQIRFFSARHELSICWVWAPVEGSMKFSEWLTVRWV